MIGFVAEGGRRGASMGSGRKTDRLACAMLCLFVFTIPWEKSVMVPGVGSIAKTLGVLAFAAGAAALIGRRKLRPWNLPLALCALFVAWSALSYFWSLDAAATVARAATFTQLFAMLWLIWEFCRGERRVRQLMASYVLGATAGAAIAFARYSLEIQTYYRRYAATGFDPNDFGLVLTLSIPMALYLAFRGASWWRWLWFVPVLAVVAAVLLTASRTSLIATFVALSFGFAVWPWSNWRQRAATALLPIALALAVFRVTPAPQRDRLATIPSEVTQGSLNSRKQIWKAGAKVWLAHPVLGVGSGAYPEAVRPLIGTPALEGFRYVAHNTFLSVLVESGAVGFSIWAALMLVLAVFVWMMPPWERALFAVMLAVWAAGVSTLTWEHYKPTWLLFGLVMAVWSRSWWRSEER